MSHFRSISQIAFGAVIALMSSTHTAASTDFRQIADYFAIPLDAVVDYQQQPSLGKNYAQYFQTSGDFNYEIAKQFGVENPRQIVPLRDYLQQLVDDGYIEQATALALLREATLGAVMTFGAQKQAMIQRPVERDVQDEREVSDGRHMDQLQTSLNEKINGLSERVDALARLINLSEAHQNDQQVKTREQLESIQTGLDLKMKDSEEFLSGRLDRLDQQIGTLSDDQFKIEIKALLKRMTMIQTTASEQSKSIQNQVDNALFEIFARISQSISESEQREQKFIDNELRLFRDTSDLRARIKRLEETITREGVPPNEYSSQKPALPNKSLNSAESVKNKLNSTTASQTKPENTKKSVEGNTSLIGAASVISKPTRQTRQSNQLINADKSSRRTNWSSESSSNP